MAKIVDSIAHVAVLSFSSSKEKRKINLKLTHRLIQSGIPNCLPLTLYWSITAQVRYTHLVTEYLTIQICCKNAQALNLKITFDFNPLTYLMSYQVPTAIFQTKGPRSIRFYSKLHNANILIYCTVLLYENKHTKSL